MEYKRKLPHFDHVGSIFFVTFRLENSLPADVAKALKEERADAINNVKNSNATDKKQLIYDIERTYFLRFEGLLDNSTYGDRYLNEPACAKIVTDALHEYDSIYYDLGAYCVMPNHVHILIDTSIQLKAASYDSKKYQHLHAILRRIKGKTGLFLNRLRQTSGQVWLEESYDRYIRNTKHYFFVEDYILDNPKKAGLGTLQNPYPFVYVKKNW